MLVVTGQRSWATSQYYFLSCVIDADREGVQVYLNSVSLGSTDGKGVGTSAYKEKTSFCLEETPVCLPDLSQH